MILYRDKKSGRTAPPPWLDGAPDLVSRDSADGRLWTVGDPLLLGPALRWTDLDDGWQARILDPLDPATLFRRDLMQTYAVSEVHDLRGLSWFAPVLVDADGNRLFRCSRGKDWRPVLAPAQEHALEACHDARSIFLSGDSALPVEAGCQYAAEFLALVNCVSPEVMATLGLMDERLALEVLQAATSQTVKASVDNGQ
jgi:hypothetical protein